MGVPSGRWLVFHYESSVGRAVSRRLGLALAPGTWMKMDGAISGACGVACGEGARPRKVAALVQDDPQLRRRGMFRRRIPGFRSGTCLDLHLGREQCGLRA